MGMLRQRLLAATSIRKRPANFRSLAVAVATVEFCEDVGGDDDDDDEDDDILMMCLQC